MAGYPKGVKPPRKKSVLKPKIMKLNSGPIMVRNGKGEISLIRD